MKLIFQNSKKEERILAESDSLKECLDKIKEFLKEKNFKSYYQRTWEENGRLKIDVGSWTEFFFLEGISYEEYVKEITI